MATPGYSSTPFPLTGDALLDLTTHGYKWVLGADRTVDWSISNGFNGEVWFNPAALVEQLTAMTSTFSYYANIKFNYIGNFSSPTAAGAAGSEINFSLSNSTGLFPSSNIWALGFFDPRYATDYPGEVGDIYLNVRSAANSLPSYGPGSAGWFVFLHEFGHVVGLKHPHDDGGTGRPTASQLQVPGLDKDWATIMSYRDDFDWNLRQWDPTSPMIMDVLALQYLYGKNMSTNAGDTVFTLRNTNTYVTLWDASGNDTVQVEPGLTNGWSIELPRYQFSSLVDTKVGIANPMAENNLGSPLTLYWLAGDIENVRGGGGADTLVGNDAANHLDGGAGNDTLVGGGGDDTFDNDASMRGGVDSFIGGTGNDTYCLDNLSDLVTEYANEGTDTVWVSFNASLAGLPYVENISSYANFGVILSGNAGNNELRGSAYNDTLDGGAGTDTVVYTGNRGSYSVTQSGNVTTVSGNGAGTDVLSSIEFVRFADQTVSLAALQQDTTPPVVTEYFPTQGATGVNVGTVIQLYFSENIKFGSGSILLKNALGNVVQSYDVANNGGSLSIALDSLIIGHSAELSPGATYTIVIPAGAIRDLAGNSYAGTSTYSFTTAGGSQGVQVFNGSPYADRVTGTAGNDIQNGLAGNDLMVGTPGNDTLDGGDGNDLVDYSNSGSAVVVNLATGTASGGTNNDKLISIESVWGSGYNDTLIGDSGDNFFEGLGGNDSIDGGAGFDTLSYVQATVAVTVNLQTQSAMGGVGVGNDTVVNFEEVMGSDLADSLTGATGAETLWGEHGNDTLSGGGGNDTLIGGMGNDSLDGGSGLDQAQYNGFLAGYKLIRVGSAYSVSGADGTDTVLNVERLKFADGALAFDLGAGDFAGQAALVLGATLSPVALANKALLGAFIGYFDNGGSLKDGAALLVGAGIVAAFAGGADNTSVVKFIYTNVYGNAPDAATLATLVAPLNANTSTQAQFLMDMALSQANQIHVGLAGMVGTGLAYA